MYSYHTFIIIFWKKWCKPQFGNDPSQVAIACAHEQTEHVTSAKGGLKPRLQVVPMHLQTSIYTCTYRYIYIYIHTCVYIYI